MEPFAGRLEAVAARLRTRMPGSADPEEWWFASLGYRSVTIDLPTPDGTVTVWAAPPMAGYIRARLMPTVIRWIAAALGVAEGDIHVVLRVVQQHRKNQRLHPGLGGVRAWPDLAGLEEMSRKPPLFRMYDEFRRRREAGELVTETSVLDLYDPRRGLLECIFSQLTGRERAEMLGPLNVRFRLAPSTRVDRQVLHEVVRSLPGIPSKVSRGRLRTRPLGTSISVQRALVLASQWFGVPVEDLVGRSRESIVVFARLNAVHLLRRVTHQTQPQIGERLGRDHKTIGHAEEQAAAFMRKDATLRAGMAALARECDREGLSGWVRRMVANYGPNSGDGSDGESSAPSR